VGLFYVLVVSSNTKMDFNPNFSIEFIMRATEKAQRSIKRKTSVALCEPKWRGVQNSLALIGTFFSILLNLLIRWVETHRSENTVLSVLDYSDLLTQG